MSKKKIKKKISKKTSKKKSVSKIKAKSKAKPNVKTKSKPTAVRKRKPTLEKVGRVPTDSVFKHTGRDWDDWIKILNIEGAQHWSYNEISKFLAKKFKLNLWWTNIVAYGYEVHIGRRIDGQNYKGLYAVTVTRSLSHPHLKVWNALMSPEGMQVWLKPLSEVLFIPKNTFEVEGGIFGEVRTMKSPERVRFTWQDTDWEKPTVVQLMVVTRPKDKSLIMIMHESIKTSALREEFRALWKKRIAEFEEFLKSN